MKLNKIKLIIFHPYSLIGGADRSIARLIDGLDKNIYEIIFITLKKPKINKYLQAKVKIINLKCSKTIFSISKVRKILKKIPKSDKTIFFSNQNFANIISFFVLYKLKHIKHVIVERNHIDEFKFNSNLYQKIKKNIIKFCMSKLYKYADLVLGNAKKLSEDLSKLINADVKTIYNPAYDKDIINLSKKEINFNLFSKNIILNIGRLEIQKDQITILKAIKNLKHVNLIIIGYGSLNKKLKIFIKKNNLKNRVVILENVSNPYPYFRIANLFISSSLYEGFPNVITEAIMFNVPVISSNCNSGPSEILLQKSGCHIFKTGNSNDLENKISAFFKNNKILNKRNKILKNNLKNFDKKKIINQYNDTFLSLFK